MSDKEEVEVIETDNFYEDQCQKTTHTEMDQEAEDESSVHFEVLKSKDGEQYKIVKKPNKPIISMARSQSNKNRRSSQIWDKFTIVDHAKSIASCGLCGMKLSFRSTVSNLKNHLNRKHSLESISRALTTKFKDRHRTFPSTKKKALTELGGLDGLILNVVRDDGDPINIEDEVVEESVVYTSEGNAYDFQIGTEDQTPESAVKNRKDHRPPASSHKVVYQSDQLKKSRILDLQLECLEMKKYTMQMEALVLEQQLNLPRSLYTQSLREVDVWTRGTQTEVGGDNTKVFYVSDKAGESQGAHLFTFRGSIHQ